MLDKMQPQADYIVFCENDSSDNTLEIITEYAKSYSNVKVLSFKSKERGYIPIATNRDKLLHEARRLNCDYTIFLDSDIEILNLNFLEMLAAWNKDVVGVKYFIKKNINDEKSFVVALFQSFFKGFYFVEDLTEIISSVVCVGFGCVCLSNKIVQDARLNFVPLVTSLNGHSWNALEDFGYCIKANQLGYSVFVDNTVKVLHLQDLKLNRPWRS